MFEKFDIDDKNIFKVCVIATMSSGKSTFINSIIGEEVMPEKNEACTARTMAVLDNDAAMVKKAHIIRKDGAKEVVEIDSREVLDRVNNDEDVVDFLVETDIQSISNTSRALMLVDTPGVNNSGDARHGERTEEFLKQMDKGVIVYLLNATQLATNDDALLLQLVSDHIKKQNGKVKIIFVINKIDALDLETESIAGTVRIAKEYIEKHNIANPVIYPLSARAAKMLRMALYRKEMTRREIRSLEDIYEHYQSKDNNMLAFAMTDEMAGESYEIGDFQVTAQELQRAIENTGIIAIEKRLESFMRELEQHYAPEIVIKSKLSESAAQEFQKRLDEIASLPTSCNCEKFNNTNARIAHNSFVQSRNKNLTDMDSISVKIDMQQAMDTCSTNITADTFMFDMEEIKKNIFERFETEQYIAVKHATGTYFYPEKNEISRISIKHFYLMSENGNKWKSIHFSQVTKNMEENKSFYLYNAYTNFLFKVMPENATDIIALLDTKIPVGIIKIAGMSSEKVPIDDMKQYISMIEAEAEAERKEIASAEEQLKRTYKGIVFDSVKQKDDVIKAEQEIQEYCLKLEEKSHGELWQKKKEIITLPNSIFSEYVSKLISTMDIKEHREKNTYLERIKIAELNGLDLILKDLEKEHYSEAVKNAILDNVEERRLQCQESILNKMLETMESFSRSELKDLIEKLKEKKFNQALTNNYVEKVNRQYDLLEMQELRGLCSNIENLSISELENLEQSIKKENYQDKFAQQYYHMIHERIEFLHIKNMEGYCIEIATVDKETLEVIEKKIKDENCRPELKTKFLDLVEQRRERLEYEELCLLTADLQDKNLNELEELYKKLQTGKYNEKFVNGFIIQSRVYLESAQQAAIEESIKNLSDMTKDQVIAIRQNIEKGHYPDRVLRLAMKRIDERIYELDMYELMELNNEFNYLGLTDIENLRSKIQQKNVCDRARQTYKKKLEERELVLAYQLVSQASCFAKQNLEQNGLSELNFVLPIFCSNYYQHLELHICNFGKVEYDDIPVFFFPECSELAMSKTHFYWHTALGYGKAKLSEIRAFTIEKKLFREVLVITSTNGNSITLTGGLNKKYSQGFVNFLTIMHANVNNEMLLSRYQLYQQTVLGLSRDSFEMQAVSNSISKQTISEILIEKLTEIRANKKNSSVKYIGINNWDSYSDKVRNGMGICNDQVICYYDKTLLGSAKDGFAIGESYIHLKKGKQPLISIPITDIYEVIGEGEQVKISTKDNNIFYTEFMVSDEELKRKVPRLMDDYVKGIQLVNHMVCYKETQKETVVPEDIVDDFTSDNETIENVCPNCNARVKIGAKFCMQCGTRLAIPVEENLNKIAFCMECGNKIVEGARFCAKCGTKVKE